MSCGAAFIAFIVAGTWLHKAVNRQGANGYLKLFRTLLEAGINRPAVLETTKAQCQQQFGEIANRQNAEMKKADEEYAAATAEIERRKERDLKQAEAVFPQRLAEIAASRDRALPAADEKYGADYVIWSRALPPRPNNWAQVMRWQFEQMRIAIGANGQACPRPG